MGLSVRNVIELVGPNRSVRFRLIQLVSKAFGVADEVVRVFIRSRWNLDEFGTRQPQSVFFLIRLRLGNDNNRAITERRTDYGEANPGIASRSLNDRTARTQRTTRLSISDHRERRAIFDGLPRIHKLSFAVDLAAGNLRSFF